MFSLVYTSCAVAPFSKEQLLKLLATARRNNETQGITGLLLYKDGNFMQLLEGEEAKVREVVAKIARDRRHKGITILHTAKIEERQFQDWAMGFYDLHSPQTKEIPGYSDFLNTPLTGAEFLSNPTKCQKLLLCFKKTFA